VKLLLALLLLGGIYEAADYIDRTDPAIEARGSR